MVEIGLIISIFTINVNGLNILDKEKDFQAAFKEKMEKQKTFRLRRFKSKRIKKNMLDKH